MKFLLILVTILVILLFIPFPLKLEFRAYKDDFYLKLYGFTIISKEKLELKNNNEDKKDISQNKKNKSSSKSSKKPKFKASSLKKLAKQLYYSKFKPVLNINADFSYSFNDAAKTAVAYGPLCEIPNIFYLIFKIIFRIHKYKFKINPIFRDELILNFEIRSIIFLSIANIINMLFIVLKFYKNVLKEVTP